MQYKPVAFGFMFCILFVINDLFSRSRPSF